MCRCVSQLDDLSTQSNTGMLGLAVLLHILTAIIYVSSILLVIHMHSQLIIQIEFLQSLHRYSDLAVRVAILTRASGVAIQVV